MCKYNKLINGGSQEAGPLIIKSNFVILIKIDINNNQKHFMVSHLTTQDRRKPPSYSAVSRWRSDCMGEISVSMRSNVHQYFLTFSEK